MNAPLNLYRRLLRYGQQLQLTDREYYYRRIRKEFSKNRNLSDPKDIAFSLMKGEAVLKNNRIV